jgi:single-stranded-DNA-specific exonuclease
VALGIVADVATLRADVRYLLQRGLDVLRLTQRLGLQAMMELADLRPELLTEEEISFALAPRLNAISRVGQELGPSAGVELLITDDRTRARTIATALEALNARRRWLTREITDAAMAQLDRDRTLYEGPAIVVAGADWDPGIVGIVAGRLAERFNKPAIVISAPPEEMARGSARSVEGVDIHAAIAAQRDMLYRCGGHPMAAGLSLESDRIDAFRRALWRTMQETAALPAEPEIAIDAYLSLDQISVDLVKAIQPLSPFGPGNEAPVFATRGLSVASNAIIGRTREHRRLMVRDPQGREETVLWWRSADQSAPESPFDLAYTLGINAFRGQESVQLTWVAARVLAPVPVRAAPKRSVAVRDYRNLAEPEPALHALLAGEGTLPSLVWGEGEQLPGVSTYDRTALRNVGVLAIWTAPPGPSTMHAALEAASPSEVALFGIDPGLDTPRPFLRRLAGLVKYAVHQRDGRIELPKLAAAMAHTETTVRLGLEWLEQKGQIEITSDGETRVRLRAGGQVGNRLHVIEGRLEAELAESAAYRSYFRRASAESLVR